jgi:hypothetical protein
MIGQLLCPPSVLRYIGVERAGVDKIDWTSPGYCLLVAALKTWW